MNEEHTKCGSSQYINYFTKAEVEILKPKESADCDKDSKYLVSIYQEIETSIEKQMHKQDTCNR